MPVLRAGTVVTFINKVVTGVDEYGNDVYGSVNVQVPGCAVSPGNSSEDIQGTSQVISDIIVHAPAGTLVLLPFDQMIVNGVTYNVVGDPRSWVSPFTGTASMEEIQGRLVTTGGAAT